MSNKYESKDRLFIRYAKQYLMDEFVLNEEQKEIMRKVGVKCGLLSQKDVNKLYETILELKSSHDNTT